MDEHRFVFGVGETIVEFTATIVDAAFMYRRMIPVAETFSVPITIGFTEGPQYQSGSRYELLDAITTMYRGVDSVSDLYCLATQEVEDDTLVIDLGNDEYGLIPTRVLIGDPTHKVEVWYDHKHSGSGVNNLRIDAFGKELDLEFVSSRDLNNDEFRHWQSYRNQVRKPVKDILRVE